MAFNTVNLASKFAPKMDERFEQRSQASLVTNKDWDFNGVNSINIYSTGVATLNDYARHADAGVDRYGTPTDLTADVQTLTLTQDKSFTKTIDRGDKLEMNSGVLEAGKFLAKETNEVIIPTYDAYVFRTIANAAKSRGADQYNEEVVSATNAYESLLEGQEYLTDMRVPETGRVLLATPEFCNYLLLDQKFVRYGDVSQEMLKKGIVAVSVDGLKITQVSSSKMPRGCSFILTHPYCTVAPEQLKEFKIHDNPPGLSGWKIEGRMIYDAFVLEEKASAIYYHGGRNKLAKLDVIPTIVSTGKYRAVVAPIEPEAGNKYVYTVSAAVPTVTPGTAFTDGSDFTQDALINGTAKQFLTVVEVNASTNMPVAMGYHRLSTEV